jgi:cell division protein FtsW (lipid II flippase)
VGVRRIVWDTKRQIIWLGVGLAVGTFFVYSAAFDDDRRFDRDLFIFMEALLVIIILVMFYIYSRKSNQ